MRGRRTWGALVALTLTVGGCSLIEGDDDATSSPTSSSATSRPSSTPARSSFELFDPPREGRDWVVLVEDPGEPTRSPTSSRPMASRSPPSTPRWAW